MVSHYDNLAASFADLALDAQFRIPEQLAIMGMNNDELICEGCKVPLSSQAQIA